MWVNFVGPCFKTFPLRILGYPKAIEVTTGPIDQFSSVVCRHGNLLGFSIAEQSYLLDLNTSKYVLTSPETAILKIGSG